jgi:hypothetical protein
VSSSQRSFFPAFVCGSYMWNLLTPHVLSLLFLLLTDTEYQLSRLTPRDCLPTEPQHGPRHEYAINNESISRPARAIVGDFIRTRTKYRLALPVSSRSTGSAWSDREIAQDFIGDLSFSRRCRDGRARSVSSLRTWSTPLNSLPYWCLTVLPNEGLHMIVRVNSNNEGEQNCVAGSTFGLEKETTS